MGKKKKKAQVQSINEAEAPAVPLTEEQQRAQIESLISTPAKTKNSYAPKKVIKPVIRYNIPLLLMLTIIVVFGLVVLYSVSGPDAYGIYNDSGYFLKKQLTFTAIGYVGLFFISLVIPMDLWASKTVSVFMGAVSIGLVVATSVFGSVDNGARRWLKIGSNFKFQTSEVVKLALILAFAGYCKYRSEARAENEAKGIKEKPLKQAFFDFILPVGGAVLVDIFIVLQPHLSCFIIIALVIFMCALSAGIPLKSWLIGGAVFMVVGVIGLGVALIVLPQEKVDSIKENYSHVFKRVEIYTADEENTTLTDDDTRQIDNAYDALGSGGMWGVGLGNSRSKYNYVSEAQNDYIFSIYVEETGFVGGLILILMYLSLFAMCVAVVLRANGPYARVVSAGCTALVFVEFLMNLSVELQVMPSTGVTLPFFSYGGTAQIMLLFTMGFILNVSKYGTAPKQKTVKEGDAK